MQASPANPVTNAVVTLKATVTSTVQPSGTITFENAGRAIAGCANLPVAPPTVPVSGKPPTGLAACTTSFPASNVQLTAAFTPGGSSGLAASASAPDKFTVGRDATSTTLDVLTTADVGQSITYTATVTPPQARPGPIEPTGSVEFFDGGTPIATCLTQALANGGATCTVSYGATGSHSITASYGGDSNFTGSAAAAQVVNVVQPPTGSQSTGSQSSGSQSSGSQSGGSRSGTQTSGSQPSPSFLASITATMQWTFYYTPTYTVVRTLVINGASGATVLVNCHGGGCPFPKAMTVAASRARCAARRAHVCLTHGKVDLTSRFRIRRLAVGARITIAITRRGWIGKYYAFTIRASRGPRIAISCLAPGLVRPRAGANGQGCGGG